MKTIKQIKESIKTEQVFVKKQRKLGVKRGVVPAIKKIKYYRHVILFLETKPNEQWLINKKAELQRIIRNKLNNYHYWVEHCCTENDSKKQRKVFNKENNITKLRQQIKFINFLLN